MPSESIKSMKEAAELDLDVGEEAPPEEKPREPWEQRVNETGRAYEAFKKFLDLGLARKIVTVSEQNPDINENTAGSWAGKHEWWNRAKAWDLMKQRLKTAAVKAAVIRISDMEMESFELSAKFILNNWKRIIHLQEINEKFVLMPSELAIMMDVMVKLRRLSSGQSTDHVEVEGLNKALADMDSIIKKYTPKD